MPDVVIESSVINSPFEKPRYHFRFPKNVIANEVIEGRCISKYFVSILRTEKKGSRQLTVLLPWMNPNLARVNELLQFTGADEPYQKLKRALRAEIDESAWIALYSVKSYPFEKPKSGKIAIKVINHYGDEVLKVFDV